MFEREQIQPFPRLQTRTRQEKKPLLHVKLDDQKEEAEHWDGPIRHNFMHDWPIYSQNREVVKVTRLNQKWMATGRKSILCCNCSHVHCDVSEYKENKNKHRKHVCFFFCLFTRSHWICLRNFTLQSQSWKHKELNFTRHGGSGL